MKSINHLLYDPTEKKNPENDEGSDHFMLCLGPQYTEEKKARM